MRTNIRFLYQFSASVGPHGQDEVILPMDFRFAEAISHRHLVVGFPQRRRSRACVRQSHGSSPTSDDDVSR